ncbi:unnamed protein product [Rotaria sordida]|uniref:Uncharacterized protein n=1 Tax=Rotaria sordida TaxID=392033 RepID=A0A815ZNT7_9BILA|nr:unnamed protein product [Rotaria sordida]CAF1585226.1 unnamed protein product [Rotaria sordida]
MIRLSSLFNLNRLFQLSSILIFNQLFTSEVSTMTTDKQGKILINLAGDVMIEAEIIHYFRSSLSSRYPWGVGYHCGV